MEKFLSCNLVKSEQWQNYIKRVEKYFLDWKNYKQLNANINDKANITNMQNYKENLKEYAANCLNNRKVLSCFFLFLIICFIFLKISLTN